MISDPLRYTRIAIILHWVMAITFIGMLASGLIMESDLLEKKLRFQLYQLHKSCGVLLLISFFARLAWRITHTPPAMPDSLKKLDIKLAKLGHIGLYILMIAMPLTGWAIVSTSSSGIPTIVFNWFEWPHIPNIASNKPLHELAEETHELLAYGMIALIIGHIIATFKHILIDKTPLLRRMWFK